VHVQSQFKSVEDVEQWPAVLDWLMDRHAKLRAAVAAIGGVASLVWVFAKKSVPSDALTVQSAAVCR
jgi:hypothetical protein